MNNRISALLTAIMCAGVITLPVSYCRAQSPKTGFFSSASAHSPSKYSDSEQQKLLKVTASQGDSHSQSEVVDSYKADSFNYGSEDVNNDSDTPSATQVAEQPSTQSDLRDSAAQFKLPSHARSVIEQTRVIVSEKMRNQSHTSPDTEIPTN